MSTRRRIYIRKGRGRWLWECWLCQPPASGATSTFAKVLSNVSRHCENRKYHHRWVRGHWGG